MLIIVNTSRNPSHPSPPPLSLHPHTTNRPTMSPSAPAVAPTQAVQYGTDARYPGPQTHPPPAYIEGIPTQADLDGYPRIFTWGELKGIVREWCLSPVLGLAASRIGHDPGRA